MLGSGMIIAGFPLFFFFWPKKGPSSTANKPAICRQCGYNLHGLPEKRCPECGTPFN